MSKAPLTFTVITDLHYYAKENGVDTKSYERANAKSQLLMKDSAEVLTAAFAQMAKDKESDIILMGGDTTSNGEFTSHEGFINLCRALKRAGKRVYTITATHDFQDDGKTNCYLSDEAYKIDCAKREDLYEMYREFGMDEAIALHKESMSYVVQLEEGYRLFALNDDKNLKGASGFSDELFMWIALQLKDARENDQQVIMMTHHPVISPSEFYSIIGKNDMMGEHALRREQLADLGVSFIFTGHSHVHDISYMFSQKGNPLYAISTTSPVGYPGYYRRVTLDPDNETLDIKTVRVDEDNNLSFNGKALPQHLEDQFFGMIRNVIDAAATDIDDLAEKVQAFSVKKKLIYKIGWLIKPFAKWFRGLKVGTVAKWTKKETGLKPEDYAHIKDERVVDFAINLPMNLYAGDGAYTPDTPYYKITMGLLAIIDSFLETIGMPISKLLKGTDSIRSMVEPLLYKQGIPSKDVVLPLHPTKEKLLTLFPIQQNTIHSKKGVGVLITLILLVIVAIPLLPAIALLLLIGFVVNQIKYGKKMND
ncbi:MAG: metallophosphoesterase [Clostridia bacterium]|nr:metallophosphoesterase [Clostridia bacterium]